VSVADELHAYTFAYNGKGDRLRQAVDGAPVSYTLDLNAGLTQVLADGTNAYLYGAGRIGEMQSAGWAYHHGDALASVRQLTIRDAVTVLAQTYEPFGNIRASAGASVSSYGFAGEWTDQTTLLYLRARYLSPRTGRFLQADIVALGQRVPQMLNQYAYASNNPMRYIDPSGRLTEPQIQEWSDVDVNELQRDYSDIYRMLRALHFGDKLYGYRGTELFPYGSARLEPLRNYLTFGLEDRVGHLIASRMSGWILTREIGGVGTLAYHSGGYPHISSWSVPTPRVLYEEDHTVVFWEAKIRDFWRDIALEWLLDIADEGIGLLCGVTGFTDLLVPAPGNAEGDRMLTYYYEDPNTGKVNLVETVVIRDRRIILQTIVPYPPPRP
jgi:RHS repeat-associated protein